MRNCALILAACAVFTSVYCEVFYEEKFTTGKL